jgi:hypothetical protein
VTYAEGIGEHTVVCLSAQNLDEEGGTDEVLSHVTRCALLVSREKKKCSEPLPD